MQKLSLEVCSWGVLQQGVLANKPKVVYFFNFLEKCGFHTISVSREYSKSRNEHRVPAALQKGQVRQHTQHCANLYLVKNKNKQTNKKVTFKW